MSPTETKALVERLRKYSQVVGSRWAQDNSGLLSDAMTEAAAALEPLTREPDDGTVERLSGLLREWNKQLGGCEHGSYVIGGCGKCLGCRTRAALTEEPGHG